MSTEKNLDVNATQNAEETAERTFTQDDVNRIVANRVAKYADYETLKEKAAKFDEAEEAAKSELQKAQEKAQALQEKIDAMEKAAAVKTMREEVSKETGVPVHLLNGETKEACEAQAAAINEFKGTQTYPQVKDAGEVQLSHKKTNAEIFEEFMNQL